jgi:PKD repeat protein
MQDRSDRPRCVRLRRTSLLAAVAFVLALSGAIASQTGAAHPTEPSAPHGALLAAPTPHSDRAPPSAPSARSAPLPSGPERAFLPPAPPHTGPTGLNVDPTNHYTSEPAPMGIADFGVSGTNGYSYSTNQWLGNYSWTTLCINGCGPAGFTVQMNVVLQFVQGGQTYDYWIQDVAEATSESGNRVDMGPTAYGLGFIDNVWNFSGPANGCGYDTVSGFTGNGTFGYNSGCGSNEYYYDEASASLPGATSTLTGPANFYLLVRTWQNAQGEPVVVFGWNDGSGWVGFDTVTWTFATAVTSFQQFTVDGSNYNGLGLFTDAELDQGGPGGGSAVTMSPTSDAKEQLEFWNGHNFQNTPSAWNFGGDTAEAISSDQSIWSQDGNGTPQTTQLNGTTRNATPEQAWRTGEVGQLVVWTPTLPSGTVSVGTKGWSYEYGWTELTLVPGVYPVWVNSTSSNWLGDCTISAGALLNVSLSSVCPNLPALSRLGASSASVDVGQSVTFAAGLKNPGNAPDTFSWTISPASGLGCATSSSNSISCVPTNSNVYSVTLTVTDSKGNSASAMISAFKVYSDPTVAVPTPSAPSGIVGTAVTFTTSHGLLGSGGDKYAWSESPASGLGCPVGAGLSLTCTPTVAGTYTVTVTVTDSNLGTGSNTSASFVVLPLDPVVTSPTVSPTTSTDIGLTVNFTSTLTSPGEGQPVTYAWTITPSAGLGCIASTTLTLECTPTAVGNYSVTITATDKAGDTGSATLTPFQVFADPTMSGVAAAPPAIDVTQSTVLTAVVTNPGSGTDTFVWSTPSGLGCAANPGDVVTCRPTSAGSFSIKVTLTDLDGGKATVSASYIVDTPPALTDPVPAPGAVTVGQTVTWSTTVTSPGTGMDQFTWSPSSVAGMGCTASTTDTIVCVPTAAGTYVMTVTLTDASGMTASETSSTFTVSVPVPLSGTATANVTSGYASLSVGFSASAQGGTTPYTFTWRFGDGGKGTGLDVSHVYSAIGTFVATLWINDSAGNSVVKTISITTSALPQPKQGTTQSSSSSFLSQYGILLVLVVLVVVAALGALLWVRRKKPKAAAIEDPAWNGVSPGDAPRSPGANRPPPTG